MEQLPNGYTLNICDGAFPLSTDSMVLAHFIRLPKQAKVLDLGAGCGTLGLLLCASDPGCHVTGIELTETAHEAATENIRQNDLQSRMVSICTDLRTLPTQFHGRFDVCVSNPPYFSGGPASCTLPTARREDCCTAADLFKAAGKVLKYGGDFYLVHRPERLAELIARGSEVGLEAKRLRFLRHREDQAISLILLQFRKGGKPGLIIEEVSLFDKFGNPTSYYQEVYHIH